MKKWMIGAVALMIATIGFAQPQDHGKMDGGHKSHKMDNHRGGMHRGGMHRGGMPFAKLNLTDAQKEQMKAINQDFKAQMQTLMSKEDITVKQQRDQRAALAKAHKANMDNILTPDQKNQLVQMKADAKKKNEEMAAKRMDRMKEKLGLSDAQVAKIKSKQEANRSKMQALMQNEQLDRESKKQQAMALRSDMKKTFDEVLTPEQKATLETIKKEQKEKGQHFRGRMHDREIVK